MGMTGVVKMVGWYLHIAGENKRGRRSNLITKLNHAVKRVPGYTARVA
jgi:hypothetical protein